jgi:hypothetical protein
LTSDATDAPTRAFFDEKEYFGLDESQVKPILAFQRIAGYGIVCFSESDRFLLFVIMPTLFPKVL